MTDGRSLIQSQHDTREAELRVTSPRKSEDVSSLVVLPVRAVLGPGPIGARRPAFLWSQSLEDFLGPLSPPVGQQRRVQTFAAEKGTQATSRRRSASLAFPPFRGRQTPRGKNNTKRIPVHLCFLPSRPTAH